jgi:hypothetical protein
LVNKIGYLERAAKDYDVKIKMRKFTRLDGDPRLDQSPQDFISEAQKKRDCCLAEAERAKAELVSFDNVQANLSKLARASSPADLVFGPLLQTSFVQQTWINSESTCCCRVELILLKLELILLKLELILGQTVWSVHQSTSRVDSMKMPGFYNHYCPKSVFVQHL